jgi:hypothetical protein
MLLIVNFREILERFRKGLAKPTEISTEALLALNFFKETDLGVESLKSKYRALLTYFLSVEETEFQELEELLFFPEEKLRSIRFMYEVTFIPSPFLRHLVYHLKEHSTIVKNHRFENFVAFFKKKEGLELLKAVNDLVKTSLATKIQIYKILNEHVYVKFIEIKRLSFNPRFAGFSQQQWKHFLLNPIHVNQNSTETTENSEKGNKKSNMASDSEEDFKPIGQQLKKKETVYMMSKKQQTELLAELLKKEDSALERIFQGILSVPLTKKTQRAFFVCEKSKIDSTLNSQGNNYYRFPRFNF